MNLFRGKAIGIRNWRRAAGWAGAALLLLLLLGPLGGAGPLSGTSSAAEAAPSTTYTVCASGCDYASIQTAINNSPSGSTIHVLAGTYYEKLWWGNKDLILQGDGPDTTIIESPSGGTVVEVTGRFGPVTSASLISGFTIRGGNIVGNSGGGIRIDWEVDIRVENNHITGNHSSLFGGGIVIDNRSSPTLVNNVIDGNTARFGGGVGMFAGGSPLLQGNQITGNTATEDGGGLYIKDNGMNPTIVDNLIQGNTASFYGGGIIASVQTAPIIDGNTIDSNVTGYDGGGVVIQNNSTGQLINNTITNNQASADPSYSGIAGGVKIYGSAAPLVSGNTISFNSATDGGGMYIENLSSPTVTGNTVTYNTGTGYGGGVVINNSPATLNNNDISNNQTTINGGGIMVLGSAAASIEWNTIGGNESTNGGGGGVYFLGGDGGSFQGNTVSDNRAVQGGGGLVVNGSAVNVSGNKILDNTADSYGGGILIQSGASGAVVNNLIAQNGVLMKGGGIYVGSASPTICNNTIVDNTAPVGGTPGSGEGIYVYGTLAEPASPAIENNIVASHTYGIYADGYGGTPSLSYNDVWNSSVANYRQAAPGPGDISADPQFVDPANGDYHLRGGSPVVDAGTDSNAPALDIDGDGRPVDGNGDSVAVPDMGADEMICTLPDFNGDGQVSAYEVQTIAGNWHLNISDPQFDPQSDRNGDGVINVLDVMIIASAWGSSC